LNNEDLFPSSPHASSVTHLMPKQDSDGSLYNTSDDDDRLNDHGALQQLEDDGNEGSFGDSEQVVVASDQYS
jgi:hypothetical protein